ncbi:uncharacterized protein SCHCODRAFT_02643478 [Schizophyllum commune H4-8]|uniref:uncharacterized protein n=1 Tax=Schizophyllum commune (strain H4-8 / FGSC 9210) TaxID=578458 RepID=UPI0021609537|nr:uncharacterized protein SCHCODRAFT_02643478 [Schizophyllum commune H4-8]KAI5886189.1 hypothetical protein SCHCODRAFT_02643478 [Schizophyllum commune H4-8]
MADHPHRLLRPRARVYVSGGPGVHAKASVPLHPQLAITADLGTPATEFREKAPCIIACCRNDPGKGPRRRREVS